MITYDPSLIEPKWQERWRESSVFEVRRDPDRPKYFCYNPAPYVTGSLHMGHVRNYTFGDFVAKLMRLRGRSVLYTIGFDAYGLPTEMAAIRESLDPEEWTKTCLASMKRQLVSMGFGFDWRRSFLTSEPEYYRWTQWIFLRLLEEGLIYCAVGNTYWCPQCETALARTQLEDGACWICASPVERRSVREWRMRLSSYLSDLLGGLDDMRDLNGLADRGQRNLICPHRGVRVKLTLEKGGQPIEVFMAAREDWLAPCVIAVDVRDEATRSLLTNGGAGTPSTGGADAAALLDGRDLPVPSEGGTMTSAADTALLQAVMMVFPNASWPGRTAIEPRTGRRLPIVIATGLDPAFADQPILCPLPSGPHLERWAGEPPEFSSMTVYRQKDFSISRQRFWGTPIPIVLCEACGNVPVPTEELPVLAPKIVLDRQSGKLCREDSKWGQRKCPRCGKPARLDPQVMDCHMDSIWHPFRPCAGENRDFLFDPAEVEYWMPADIIQFGRDVTPFMLDLRFFSHFLHRLGHIQFREFCRDVLAHGLILYEGRKMSKHLGNVITPGEVIQRFGADSLRFYMLAHAEPRSDFRWSEEGVLRYREALSRHYEIVQESVHGTSTRTRGGAGAASDPPPRHVDAGGPNRGFGRYTNIFLKKAARELSVIEDSVDEGRYDRYASALMRLLQAIDFFFSGHLEKEQHPEFDPFWRRFVENSVLYLAPVAPHLAEECWEHLGHPGPLFATARFPEGQAKMVQEMLSQAQGQR